ncbi:MAG: hypothetical protein ABW048_13005 [Sphingobium sp.]
MKHPVLILLLFAGALPGLTACGGPKPADGANVTMRDMEVVDGTANDSMADLDNAVADGTTMTNAVDPSTMGAAAGTHGAPIGNNSVPAATGDGRTAGSSTGNSAAATE